MFLDTCCYNRSNPCVGFLSFYFSIWNCVDWNDENCKSHKFPGSEWTDEDYKWHKISLETYFCGVLYYEETQVSYFSRILIRRLKKTLNCSRYALNHRKLAIGLEANSLHAQWRRILWVYISHFSLQTLNPASALSTVSNSQSPVNCKRSSVNVFCTQKPSIPGR